jgi:hypothetical protein
VDANSLFLTDQHVQQSGLAAFGTAKENLDKKEQTQGLTFSEIEAKASSRNQKLGEKSDCKAQILERKDL